MQLIIIYAPALQEPKANAAVYYIWLHLPIMGVRAWGLRAAAFPSPPKKKWAVQFFWEMTKIWAEGAFGVRNIALIHIERAHANFVLENEMERKLDIFGSRIGRDSYFF